MKKPTISTLSLVLLLFIIATTSACHKQANAQQPQKTVQNVSNHFKQIVVRGEKRRSGMFDVTLEYDDNGIGWMAYSWVDTPKYVSTHLARSSNHGKTWHYVSTINPSKEVTLKENGKAVRGVWRYETPTLVYDRGDVPNRRWKLFAQRVFIAAPYKERTALWGKSWIEYRYARSPNGPWSKPIRAFSAQPRIANLNLNTLDRSLNKMAYYNELGSLEHNGVLYMSLDASPTNSGIGKWDKRKIILISSKDHGKHWRYVGTLTDFDDASNLGYFIFTGSSLVRVGKRNYLIVTPAGKKGLFVKNRGQDGSLVIEFEDIRHAKLKRNTKGELIITKRINPSLIAGGLSDYDKQNRNGGIVFCQLDFKAKLEDREFLRAYNTGQGIGGK